jgi:hypothetical protein
MIREWVIDLLSYYIPAVLGFCTVFCMYRAWYWGNRTESENKEKYTTKMYLFEKLFIISAMITALYTFLDLVYFVTHQK